jgi:hypothetical protein
VNTENNTILRYESAATCFGAQLVLVLYSWKGWSNLIFCVVNKQVCETLFYSPELNFAVPQGGEMKGKQSRRAHSRTT